MNKTELQRVQDDLNQGVMVCSATIRRVVAHALAQDAQQTAASPVKRARETPTLVGAWESLARLTNLRAVSNQEDCDILIQLGDQLADEVGDDESHPLFQLFSVVMVLIDEWERDNVNLDVTPDDVFPIREETLRILFEKHYGPKSFFAWRNSDDSYKNESLQHAWTLWQQAAISIMMHLTGVWEQDEDCAKRLRAVCKLVGIADIVPQSDDDLWYNAFSVLGLIRKRLKEREHK